jgi:hypothetical protein
LVELLDKEGIDLGLPFYAKSPMKLRQQMLLPQCMGCSEKQSAIAARAKAILSGQVLLSGQQPAVVRTYLAQQLTPQEFGDLCRVVLNPCVGWSNQGQSNNPSQVVFDAQGYAQLAFDPNLALPADLVTSGIPGSFAGVKDDLVGAFGDHYGCHTCIDVANQTDAYRGISWIADHQPPTALVARGLAELPQLVLPHCHACSKKQSALTRKLASVFDNCFGKGWGDEWSREVAVTMYNDVD